jgi:hypothetical protein
VEGSNFTSDYCVETPAHSSISEVCPSGFSTSKVSELESATLTEANYVDNLLYDLLANADSVGDSAVSIIQGLANLPPPSLPPITYDAPTWSDPATYEVSYTDLPTSTPPDAANTITWVSPTLNDVSAPSVSITAPTTSLPDFPTVTSITSVPAPPVAPPSYSVGDFTAPGYTTPTLMLGSADEADLASVTFVAPEPISLEALSFTIDYAPINKAIELLNGIEIQEDDIPDYEQLIPTVFTVVGSMVQGDTFNTDSVLQDNLPIRCVASSLARRGLTVPAAIISYDAWLTQYLADYSDDSATLHTSRFIDSVITASLALATEAESILYDIDLGIYDARFRYGLGKARATLEKSKGIAATYNALVAEFEGKAAEYNASLTELKALARSVSAQVSFAQMIGKANRLTGEEFAQKERGKSIEAKVFASKVNAEAQKLEAYRAQLMGLDGYLAQAQANMLEYAGYASSFSGEVQKIKNVYDLYKAKATAVIEQNRLVGAEVRGEASQLRALGAEASAKAARASIEAIRKIRISEERRAYYAGVDATNDLAGYDIAKTLAAYTADSVAARSQALVDGVLPDAVAAKARAISQFATTAMESAGRAATMAQSANETLDRAYARAYEAAGRAGAAVQSGKLSGFRASAALSAAGDLSARTSSTDAGSLSGSLNYSETDTASESISA